MSVARRACARGAGTVVAGILIAAASAAADPPPGPPPRIADASLTEASGLAASNLDPTLLWALDDSGAPPVLHAIGTDGSARGMVDVVGAANVDWEDLAAFRWRGRAWLLVADVGDNDAVRPAVTLYVLREPPPSQLAPGVRLAVPLAWRLDVRLPGGPADCEAVGVDPREGKIYLLTKRTRPPILYSVPLHPARRRQPGAVVTARREAALDGFPRSGGIPLPTPAGLFPGMPTGMSLARDGSAAAVLAYDALWLFRRARGEPWAVALGRAPERVGTPGLWQAEAVAFSGDGRAIWVTGEGHAQPLLRFEVGPIAGQTPARAAKR